jgi:hypothetical protein
MTSMCRMMYYLLLLVLSTIPSSHGIKVFDYREPTIHYAFNKNSNSNPFSYPSLKMAAVANTSTQDRLFLTTNTLDSDNLVAFTSPCTLARCQLLEHLVI